MKVPSLTDYEELITKIHQVQALVQSTIPRSLDLTIEICSDVTFVNDEHGRPVGAFNVGQDLPAEFITQFAGELQTLVSAKRSTWNN